MEVTRINNYSFEKPLTSDNSGFSKWGIGYRGGKAFFVKEFLLFYGETLEYYLTVELPDDTKQTDKKLLTMEDSLQGGNTKYQLLNQMLAGQKLGRSEQTEKAMEQYLQREHFARKMFPVLHA